MILFILQVTMTWGITILTGTSPAGHSAFHSATLIPDSGSHTAGHIIPIGIRSTIAIIPTTVHGIIHHGVIIHTITGTITDFMTGIIMVIMVTTTFIIPTAVRFTTDQGGPLPAAGQLQEAL